MGKKQNKGTLFQFHQRQRQVVGGLDSDHTCNTTTSVVTAATPSPAATTAAAAAAGAFFSGVFFLRSLK
jgi:hypothetical protein